MKRIISLLCAFSMVFVLTGCGQKEPEDVVNKFCGAVKKFDVVTMSRCIADVETPDLDDLDDISLEDIPMDVIMALREHAKSITYEIGEVLKGETTARVSLKVTYPDLSVAVGKTLGEYMAEVLGMAFNGATAEEMEELFEEILVRNLKEAEPKMRTMNMELNCILTEDGWKIRLRPGDVINILLGNIMDGIDQLDTLIPLDPLDQLELPDPTDDLV